MLLHKNTFINCREIIWVLQNYSACMPCKNSQELLSYCGIPPRWPGPTYDKDGNCGKGHERTSPRKLIWDQFGLVSFISGPIYQSYDWKSFLFYYIFLYKKCLLVRLWLWQKTLDNIYGIMSILVFVTWSSVKNEWQYSCKCKFCTGRYFCAIFTWFHL